MAEGTGQTGNRTPSGARPGDGDRVEVLDLHTLDVVPGAARTLDVAVPIAPLQIGGQEYCADPAAPRVRLDVVRLNNGWHLRLRAGAHVAGPCWRCLEIARPEVVLDATEVSIVGADDPELVSLYLHQDVLNLADWARDAVVEALPTTILCTTSCAGLCPMCGANLNEGPCGCVPDPVDSRWAALAELADRLTEPPVEPADGDRA